MRWRAALAASQTVWQASMATAVRVVRAKTASIAFYIAR